MEWEVLYLGGGGTELYASTLSVLHSKKKRSTSNSKLSLSPLVEHPNTPHRSIYMGCGRGTTHNLLERVDGWDVIININIILIDTLYKTSTYKNKNSYF